MHPLLHLLATRPDLVATHAQAYAELAASEGASALTAWKQQAVLTLLALALGCVAVALAGVGAMLWAVHGSDLPAHAWALWVVPLVPAVGVGLCWLGLRAVGEAESFAQVRRQLKDDVAMLRAVGAAG